MRKKFTKETLAIFCISLLSAVLNFANLSKEGYANSYYAAAVKSMTLSLKNFFFVSFDPSGFVSIDKPPLGYWFQTISAKIFGFSGWSIILPQAVAGVLSVITLYILVRRSFGKMAGLISALFLAVTPVFVAVSRNNTVDNMLVFFLLLACWALSIATEKGRLKYLILAMFLVGLGFNIKMLQAYLILPAVYVTYLFASSISLGKRIVHLIAGTVVLVIVSLSWALAVDSVPADSRPYVDSSTNNTVMELITGHNGLERVNIAGIIGGSSGSGGGPRGGFAGGTFNENRELGNRESNINYDNKRQPSNSDNIQLPNGNNIQLPEGNMNQPPDGSNMQPGEGGNMPQPSGIQRGEGQNNGVPPGMGGNAPGGGGLSGSFGGQTAAGLSRLFSKNILSDQIVWFIPLAIFGFIAAAFRERLKISLNNPRKQALALWFMWFLPEFIYFSYNTGTWHSYYLTMMAAPIAALAGIGIVDMWDLYKGGGWKAWLLPVSLLATGAVHILMLSYFINTAYIVKVLMAIVALLSISAFAGLSLFNLLNRKEQYYDFQSENFVHREDKKNKLKKALIALALIGILATPFVGSAAAMCYGSGGSFPAAGLELLSSAKSFNGFPGNSNSPNDSSNISKNKANSGNTALIEFLQNNKTAGQKYLLVVSSANDCADIIVQTGEPVMCLGGFLGRNNPLTLEEFKALAAKGEVRYVMAGSRGGNSNNEIMNWVSQTGKLVSVQNNNGFLNSGQLYDLKEYTDSMMQN